VKTRSSEGATSHPAHGRADADRRQAWLVERGRIIRNDLRSILRRRILAAPLKITASPKPDPIRHRPSRIARLDMRCAAHASVFICLPHLCVASNTTKRKHCILHNFYASESADKCDSVQ
ncbi:MAG: hypothetical protein ACRECF_11735, partial [Methyloceanibacter sp.]